MPAATVNCENCKTDTDGEVVGKNCFDAVKKVLDAAMVKILIMQERIDVLEEVEAR